MRNAVQQLRTDSTPAEERLWGLLRNRKFKEYKFRRQVAIDRYVVDFYCAQAHLIIEVDGPIHQFQVSEDQEREMALEAMGFHVIRFTNDQVFEKPEQVLAEITNHLNHHASPGTVSRK